MRTVRAAILCSIGLLLQGCFSDSTSEGDSGIGPTDPTSGNGAPTNPPSSGAFRAQFLPFNGILPYPNDLYFVDSATGIPSTDGTLSLPLNPLQPAAAAINTLDGFSTTAFWSIRFAGGALDPATLTAANIRVIRLTLNSATKGPLLPPAPGAELPAPLVLGSDFSASVFSLPNSTDTTLVIRPLHPLRASTGFQKNYGYLVLLTNGIRSMTGAAANPDNDYRLVRDQAISELLAGATAPTCAPITNPTLNGICRLTFGHLAIGAQVPFPAPLNPADVIVSFSFSTESTRDTLEAISATATAQPAGVAFTGFNTRDVNPGLRGRADIFVGTLQVPYYLTRPTAPNCTGPLALTTCEVLTRFWLGDPSPIDPNSRFLTRFNPDPVATEMATIPLLLTRPNATALAGAARPVDGWPVAIFQHGITGDRSQMLAIADAFADRGFVVVAIDQPLHGVADDSALYQGAIERHFNLDLINNSNGTPGADGDIDPSGTHFINLTNLLTSRDNLRQASADLITLTRTLPTLELTGDSTPDINPDRIHFVGHSLGGIVGGTYLGVASNVRSATLAMPGGMIAQLLQDSETFGPRIDAALGLRGLIPGTTLYNQFFRDAQTVVDAGDPLNYAVEAAALCPIHLIQVIGGGAVLPDQVIPNSATQRLIDAMGLTQVSTPGPNFVSHGYVNFVAGDHGSILSPAASLDATVEMQTETVVFAASIDSPAGPTIVISDPTVVE